MHSLPVRFAVNDESIKQRIEGTHLKLDVCPEIAVRIEKDFDDLFVIDVSITLADCSPDVLVITQKADVEVLAIPEQANLR